MAITKNKSRQYKVVAETAFSFSDLTSGVAAPAVDIPSGAVIDNVNVYIDEAFNSETSDAIVVGDGAVTNRFVTSVSIAATGGKGPVAAAMGYKYAAHDTIDLIWTGVGAAPTAGKGRLIVEYHHTGAGDFVQG